MALDGAAYSPKEFGLAIQAETTIGTAITSGMTRVNVDSVEMPGFNLTQVIEARSGSSGRVADVDDAFIDSKGTVKEITFSGTDFTQSVWTQVGTNTVFYPGEPMNNVAYDTTADTFVFCAGWASSGSNETDVFTYQFSATNLTASNFLGISDAAISSAASGNITIKGGIAATGLSSLTPASDYYVQDDGTITTVSSSVKAGKALSATAINLEYQS